VKKFLVILMSIAVIAAAFSAMPLFNLSQINFKGGERYSKEEILKYSKITEGMNVFRINAKKISKTLQEDAYIKSADIKIQYPDKVNITIKERKARGYVPYIGTYLYIDEEGMVLESSSSYKERLPIVEGLKFDKFKVGQVLEIDNKEAFDIVLKTSNILIKYSDMYEIEDILKIDVSDIKNIHIYMRNVDVQLGNSNDYDEKIRTMLTIMQKIPEQDKGVLDIRDINKSWIFEYLT